MADSDSMRGRRSRILSSMDAVLAAPDASSRQAAFSAARDQLAAHLEAFEPSAYAALKRDPLLNRALSAQEQVRQDIRHGLDRLDRTPVESDAWIDMFVALHHAAEAYLGHSDTQAFDAARPLDGKDLKILMHEARAHPPGHRGET